MKLKSVLCSFNSEIDLCNVTKSVQLRKFNNDTLGRLEVCYNGYWSSVCNHSAVYIDAAVVCRQFGYAEKGKHTL